jgi:solute carrier family 35 protein C2
MLRILGMVILYYPLSIGLTFYQKWFIKGYRLPLLIVSGHYLTKLFLALSIRFIVECVGKTRRPRVPLKEQLRWLMPIGVCASLDIGLSNWALEYVTVSLYTMAKSSSILFIVGFSLLLKLERWRTSLGFSASLIAAGLFLFTWRSSQLDLRGLVLVELAALCTGIRWTVSQLVMQGEDQPSSPGHHPLDMVAHVQPWMFLAILPMVFTVEGPELTYKTLTHFQNEYQPFVILGFIFMGGVLAFMMELSEYLLLVNTSGITLNILGIVKEVITLLLAHHLHGDKLTRINLFGLILCIAGMLIHGAAKHNRQRLLQRHNERMVKLDSSVIKPSEMDDRRLLLVNEL